MSEDIRDRFPYLKPIKRPPSLFRFNGFGVGMYGKRDVDAETQTYVKTHCLSLLWIPVIALGAYRVADAENGGWYFLGKEPVSGGAKIGSGVAALIIASFIGAVAWSIHTDSPDYKAEQLIAEAKRQEQAGDYSDAARTARQVIEEHLPRGAAARELIQRNLSLLLESDDPADGIAALGMIRSLPKSVSAEELFPGLPATIADRIEAWASTAPGEALNFLNGARKLYPEDESLMAARAPLIENWRRAEPDNVDALLAYAELRSADADPQAMIELLAPHRDQLESTEGARMLGQALSAVGRYEEAHGLLFPYVKKNLGQLTDLEQRLDRYTDQRWNRWVEYLQEGQGPSNFYDQYERADEAKQIELVNTFVWNRIENESSYQNLVEKYQEAASIVPVALDLGIVHLYRAQDISDPAAREEELTKAENTFLAIRGVAGDSAEYKLFLGQVKYWLGKKGEGKPLFEDLLARYPGNIAIAVQVSGALRELGDWEWAREIAETAYNQAGSTEEKQMAAHQRAFLQKDEEDRGSRNWRAASRKPIRGARRASTPTSPPTWPTRNSALTAMRQLRMRMK